MKFYKMHGLGNDFAIFDIRENPFHASPEWARAITDRHTGVGCDQIILILPPKDPAAVAYFRILNFDGSEPEASGNGTRLAASILLREAPSPYFTVETIAGLLHVDGSDPERIVVDMGPARLGWQDIGMAQEQDTVAVTVDVPQENWSGIATCTSMGNPHATFFVDDLRREDVLRIGPYVETHSLFPRKINAGFIEVTGPDRLKFEIWERGTGLTLSCGSGACAAGVAAMRRGLTGRKVTIDMELGSFSVEWREDGHVLLGGPVVHVFTGELGPGLLPR